MAASTRVERLQYKEIQTPSWKEVEVEPSSKGQEVKEQEVAAPKEQEAVKEQDAEEEELENTSDLMYKLMHAKAEEEERVRWATPLGRVHGGQRGHHGRGQSRARRLDSCRTEVSIVSYLLMYPTSPPTGVLRSKHPVLPLVTRGHGQGGGARHWD